MKYPIRIEVSPATAHDLFDILHRGGSDWLGAYDLPLTRRLRTERAVRQLQAKLNAIGRRSRPAAHEED